MDAFVDSLIKLGGMIVGVAAAASSVSWWIGSRLDKITKHISSLELRIATRLTRLETKIFNGHHSPTHGFLTGDESHDD